MRCRLMAGTIGLGCVGLMSLVMVMPAAANEGAGAGCSAPADRECDSRPNSRMAADCEQAAMDGRGRPSGLKVSADVPDGATVAPGQDIAVRLTWDPKAWSGRELDAALVCVRVKGGLDPELSGGERPTANDGGFEYLVHVPENIRPGCDICVEGFLAGMAGDGGGQQVSGDGPCFMSGEPRPPTPPATRPPTAPTPPATTATTAPRTPTEVGGITASKPAPAPLAPAPSTPEVAPAGELPRTGSPITDLAAASGGLSLTLGGLSVMGAAGRRRGRRRG